VGRGLGETVEDTVGAAVGEGGIQTSRMSEET
jgi:hypothetical protein